MWYTALRLDLDVDTGSCSTYSMSVSKIREWSGGAERTMGLPTIGARSGFSSFAGSTGGLSVGRLLLLQRSSRQEENWQ